MTWKLSYYTSRPASNGSPALKKLSIPELPEPLMAGRRGALTGFVRGLGADVDWGYCSLVKDGEGWGIRKGKTVYGVRLYVTALQPNRRAGRKFDIEKWERRRFILDQLRTVVSQSEPEEHLKEAVEYVKAFLNLRIEKIDKATKTFSELG